ncbi:Protein of unknown function DUF92, TMEM19 [Cynara cardunculus var. scolymus]|uniref:Integral membrane protein DUF92 n=1 Tax=Cynara cardunculus var. scolymus TaxID=59895 RepID=A0A103Y2G2_CYNCS|nr:Protein of unknown function DUF92, TMEM19 [Cynara cardunculus var. scolymus]
MDNQVIIAVLISFFIAFRAYRKNSLDVSGAFAGFFVMVVHLSVNYRFGAMLLAFFFSSSKLTKMGEDRKRSFDADFKEGGQRNWIQVLSNSGIATVLVVAFWNLTGSQDTCLNSKESYLITSLVGGLIGHYSCCNGDTWSSELGVLSDAQPRLITTFKPVRRGTNGGITKAGLLAAAAAGSVIGLAFVLPGLFSTSCTNDVFLKQLLVIPLSTLAGLAGSCIETRTNGEADLGSENSGQQWCEPCINIVDFNVDLLHLLIHLLKLAYEVKSCELTAQFLPF